VALARSPFTAYRWLPAVMDITELKRRILAPGSLSDLYTVGEQLGAGGYARVKRGKVKATGADVAIKIFDPR